MSKRVILDFSNGVSVEVGEQFCQFSKKNRILFALDYAEMGEIAKEMFGNVEAPNTNFFNRPEKKEIEVKEEPKLPSHEELSKRKPQGPVAKTPGLLMNDGKVGINEPPRPSFEGYAEGVVDLALEAKKAGLSPAGHS